MFTLLLRGHVLRALRRLEDESIDCVVTSPPYYGLRFYRGAETVWGGDPGCKHEFELEPSDLAHENRNNRPGTQDQVLAEPGPTTYLRRMRLGAGGLSLPPGGVEAAVGAGGSEGTVSLPGSAAPVPERGFCSRCGAWFGQLGLEPTVDLYLDHLLMVTAELKRVLKKTGTFFLNINDTYSGSNCGGGDESLFQNTKRKYIADMFCRKPSPQAKSRIPEKSLMLVPERLAVRMVDEQGWILRNRMVWYKSNTLPSSAKDRFTNKWEYVFFFVKSKKYYFDLDSVRVPLKLPYKPFNYRVREARLGRLEEKFGGQYTASPKELLGYDDEGVRLQTAGGWALGEGDGAPGEHAGGDGESSPAHRPPPDAGKVDGGEYKRLSEWLSAVCGSTFSSGVGAGTEPGDHNPGGSPPGYDTKYAEAGLYEGLMRRLFTSRVEARKQADILFPGDEEKRREYLKFIHDHFSNPKGANPGDVLHVNTKPHRFAHFAVFPEALVEPLVVAGSPPGGVVLDPFAGSGTVGVAAKRLGRSSVLIELSGEYVKIIKRRIEWGSTIDSYTWRYVDLETHT